jgi:hypothetical protein
MSGLQFVDSMTGHLVWPLVVLILAFSLRRYWGELAKRVLEFSFGGATLKIGDLIAKGTVIVDEAPEPTSDAEERVSILAEELNRQNQIATARLQESLSSLASHMTNLRETEGIADTGTRNVFRAFGSIEHALNEAGIALGVRARGNTLMQMLWRRELVGRDMVELYDSLRTARNAIAHGEADLPKDGESLEFMRQANYLVFALLEVASRIKADKGKPDSHGPKE